MPEPPEKKYILQEGIGRFELEDETGLILLEDQDIGCSNNIWKTGAMILLIGFLWHSFSNL